MKSLNIVVIISVNIIIIILIINIINNNNNNNNKNNKIRSCPHNRYTVNIYTIWYVIIYLSFWLLLLISMLLATPFFNPPWLATCGLSAPNFPQVSPHSSCGDHLPPHAAGCSILKGAQLWKRKFPHFQHPKFQAQKNMAQQWWICEKKYPIKSSGQCLQVLFQPCLLQALIRYKTWSSKVCIQTLQPGCHVHTVSQDAIPQHMDLSI